MKTQFTLWQKVANTPPTYLLVLFAWLLLPFNVSADPIAIGSGTVTLNYTNTSNPAAPAGNTFVLSKLSTPIASETCIAFGNTDWGGGIVLSKVEWSVTIVPGIYEIEFTYGTGSYGVKPLVSVYDGSTKVTDIYSAPSGQTSGAWKGQADFSPDPMDVDLHSLSADKTYTIRVIDEWGGGYGLCIGHISFTCTDCCASPATATFDTGAATSGSVDAIENCAGNTFTMPGKGSMTYAGHKFTGWKLNNAGGLIAAGTSYTMPAGGASFTAQWDAITVPVVTNASISAVGSVVTIAYSIPGKLDLSTVTTDASYFYDSRTTPTSYSYNSDSEELSVTYSASQWGQKGVAFPIVLSNLETITFESKGHRVFPEAIYTSETKSYWENDPMATSDNWETYTRTINTIYFNNGSISSVPNVDAITFCANPDHNVTGETFYVRNVFYHLTDQIDVDHVVIMRKSGKDQVSTGLSDGTLLEPGTRSRFVDEEAKAGGWYTYTIFAVHADGTLSTGVPVNVEVEDDTEYYAVTYDIDGASGTTPTAAREYAATESFSLPTQGDLTKAGHKFGGWNDGTTTYAPGASYTMPAEDVSFTAVWTPFTVPAVTDLTINGDMKTVNLSWNIPGFIDLNTANTTNMNETTYGTTFCAASNWEMNGDELDVTYSCDEWAMCGIAFTLSVDDLESVSFDCRDDNSFSSGGLYPFALADHAYYGSGITFPHTLAHHSSVFDKYWYNNSLVGATPIDDVTEIAIVSNPPSSVTDGHFFISNVRYHCTGQIDIDHIVLVRKDGSEPADPTDGDVLPVGNRFAFVDDDAAKVDGHTYYYKVFSVHADGSYSAPEAVSYTVPAPPALTTYTRENLNVGDFGTICLPYAIEAANREGAELFEIDSWAENGTSMTMTQLNADEPMTAGRPYIFQATANTATFSYYADGEEAEVGTHNGLIGSYVEAQIPENDNNYIIYNNKLYLVNAPARVGAYRAYIHRGGEYSPAPANRRRVTMGLYGTQTTTDINQISTEQITNKVIRNGHLFILRGDKIYNAQGQLVQ